MLVVVHKEDRGDMMLMVVLTDDRGEMIMAVVPTVVLTSSAG